MENRITVTIAGTDYTFTAEESPSYMQKVAAHVSEQMSAIMEGGKIGRMDAAVLAAAAAVVIVVLRKKKSQD